MKSDFMSGDEIIIVGGGLAGLFCAYKLAPRPVTVLTQSQIGFGASAWAQGGIAAAVSADDTSKKHAADTLVAGGGICDEKIVEMMTREASERIDDLTQLGVPFDVDGSGRFNLSREAAHSHSRVLRVRGDLAGKAIMEALIAAIRNIAEIHILEGYLAEELYCKNSQIAGLRARNLNDGTCHHLPAKAVILATGGIGRLYSITTNPPESQGHGLAIAARAGAILSDCEFVQFHPTALDVGLDPAPLATEALRGEGAILVNSDGERFMKGVDLLQELGPRDVVAREIYSQIQQNRGAFLDCREAIGERFPELFPTVYGACQAAGIDPVREQIPIIPAEHYHMGGILTDAVGRTTVGGLWAIGEVAATGAHGANRLASNSLLETVVFASRAAADIRRLYQHARWTEITAIEEEKPETAEDYASDDAIIDEIRGIMNDNVGVIRNGPHLSEAICRLEYLQSAAASMSVKNMALTAKIIAVCAYKRAETRGSHIRQDYPNPHETQAKRQFTNLGEIEELVQTLQKPPAVSANISANS